MSSKVQDYVFLKIVLPNVYTLEQLRTNCFRFSELCRKHRNRFYRKYLQLSGYDVSDKTTDFVKVFIELNEMTKMLEQNKDRIYLVNVDPRNISKIVMSEDLLELCKTYGSVELVDFLTKSGFEIRTTPVVETFLTPIQVDIGDKDTVPSPEKKIFTSL
jgi:hypothetical protein